MELLGMPWTVEDLVAELIKDRTYFEKSGGGVTLSGGEPTMQGDFSARVLEEVRKLGIHTAMDTCGLCRPGVLEKLLPHADMVLYDLKAIDSGLHRKFTGSENDRILGNLLRVRDYMKQHANPGDLWIRTPIIPGATDTHENIRQIGDFITRELEGSVTRWELCAFNNLCRDKYLRMDLDWAFKECDSMPRSRMEDFTRIAKQSGLPPDIIVWSGTTRMEEAA
jgi:pyruvate formate lyase activating enzyme